MKRGFSIRRILKNHVWKRRTSTFKRLILGENESVSSLILQEPKPYNQHSLQHQQMLWFRFVRTCHGPYHKTDRICCSKLWVWRRLPRVNLEADLARLIDNNFDGFGYFTKIWEKNFWEIKLDWNVGWIEKLEKDYFWVE